MRRARGEDDAELVRSFPVESRAPWDDDLFYIVDFAANQAASRKARPKLVTLLFTLGDEDAPCGIVVMQPSYARRGETVVPALHLTLVAIRPDCRGCVVVTSTGQRLADVMIEKALQSNMSANCQVATAVVHEDNEPAIAVNRRNGFVEDGAKPPEVYFSKPLIEMHKPALSSHRDRRRVVRLIRGAGARAYMSPVARCACGWFAFKEPHSSRGADQLQKRPIPALPRGRR